MPLGLALQADVLVSLKRAFRLGYITGFVYFIVLLYWIPFLPRENVTIPFLMVPMLGIMAAYLALYPAVSALGAVWLARRGVPLAFALPPIWVLAEALRSMSIFGFPWGVLGYTPARMPAFIQFAAYTGMWGVSLWIVLVNGLVLYALLGRTRRTQIAFAAIALGAVLLPLVHGTWRLRHAPKDRATVVTALVQPNVGDDKWRVSVRDSVVKVVFDRTREVAAMQSDEPPAIFVWPETAVPAPIRRDPRLKVQVKELVDELGVPLLAGYPDVERLGNGEARYTNSAALFMPEQGFVRQYDKRHLVPFSEFFPLPLLDRLDFGQANFSAGHELGVFTQLSVPFGVLICFESIFPEEARGLCRGGARYLINITNDQWFGDSAAPYQHFEMNVLRCIENGVGMARAANTGISAILDPYGRVMTQTATFIPAGVIGKVELREGMTFYTRAGDWILGVCGAWLLFGILRALRRTRE